MAGHCAGNSGPWGREEPRDRDPGKAPPALPPPLFPHDWRSKLCPLEAERAGKAGRKAKSRKQPAPSRQTGCWVGLEFNPSKWAGTGEGKLGSLHLPSPVRVQNISGEGSKCSPFHPRMGDGGKEAWTRVSPKASRLFPFPVPLPLRNQGLALSPQQLP